ncbi:hypothetical protein FSP39_009964 [Pinctada imbricata]|uniref:Integrase catalytic domain-containing protein n=1 Tax=Pinctada imbricata TaxID=66713 RepID=A0AA89BRN8_PINIB|nr:hypothetical protein FSP39_009964 [Pinctada imbricata]
MSIHSDPGVRRSMRTRTLTLPAHEVYNQKRNKHYADLLEIKNDLDSCVLEIDKAKQHKGTLEALEKLLTSVITAYIKASDRFAEFLTSVRTTESKSELTYFESQRDRFHSKANAAHNKLSNFLSSIEDCDKKSRKSSSSLTSSNSSTRSSASSILKRKEAKLEAQRARLRHLDEELELEARLEKVRAKKEFDMTASEVNALREPPELPNIVPSVSSEQRTREYVDSISQDMCTTRPADMCNDKHVPVVDPYISEQSANLMSDLRPPASFPIANSVLDPTVQPFAPRQESVQNTALVDTFTKHLVKRDLIMSRLSKYDDDPMIYVSWKASFQTIMKEIGASATEELELLCQKLGPESTKQAKTIKACNSNNPSVAISKIWERLDKRFGAAELVERYLHNRIKDFPDITTDKYHLLYDLLDLASEIASIKSQSKFSSIFAHFDSRTGVQGLAEKLPWNLKEKWTTEATKYKQSNHVMFPPFSFFVKFLENMADMKNDPAFHFERKGTQRNLGRQQGQLNKQNQGKPGLQTPIVSAKKTETTDVSSESANSVICILHKNGKHTLNDCYPFRQKPIAERKKLILTSGICFKCCSGKKHRAKNCKTDVTCSICKEKTHPTALHENMESVRQTVPPKTDIVNTKMHEGETTPKTVVTSCTHVPGVSKSCAKIVPVRIFHASDPHKVMLSYATVDDQSNQTLATSSLFDYFNVRTPDVRYTLVSCSGSVSAAGRMDEGFIVQSLDGTCEFAIPRLVECNELPNNRNEIPSSEVAEQYPHLQCISTLIPPIDDGVGMDLLIGRDIVRAHIVQDQLVGEGDQPFGQKLPLGWVIVGQICLGGAYIPDVKSYKTFIFGNGRHSNFEPCDSEMTIHQDQIFSKTDQDEKLGLSVEDRQFLDIMESSFHQDSDGHWVAPLPFKSNRTILPNNRPQALRRAKSLDSSLRNDPVKCEHVIDFMQKLFDKGHIEKAPDLPVDSERWYLPMFGIYHPRKPGSIRVVFDSSAQFQGTSLNDVLIKGPDLANNLQGILMQFRKERFAVLADVEQMFHNFRVTEDHRNYLRFLWHANNDIEEPLTEFRMTVHVFGNRTSPAVANYGIRRSVLSAEPDVQEYVCHNFYVDDGLMSFTSVEKAVDLVKRTQHALYDGGRLRLHKVASNSTEVLAQFPKEDLAKDLKNLDFGHDSLPEQRSLGIAWDIMTDSFVFRVNPESKPFTRRGVLSVINSLFDPIGITAPVTLEGKLLLREAMTFTCDWDEPLPDMFRLHFEKWVYELNSLQNFSVPRMYCDLSVEESLRVEIHVFSDASRDAVAAVAFIKVFSGDRSEVGFLLGKAKVAPAHGHTIPRLELCAAVLAVEIAEIAREQLCLQKDVFTFYTDSQVVLGYISNDSKRFHVYVANRVSRIRSFCGPEYWRHVTSDQNPADVATRGCSALNLPNSIWITGPSFLAHGKSLDPSQTYDLVDPETDQEVRKNVVSLKTAFLLPKFWCGRFERISKWTGLVRGIMVIKRMLARRASKEVNELDLKENVQNFIIKQVQLERYPDDIHAISNGKGPPRNSTLLSLNPVMDQNGILRVGGRVSQSNMILDGNVATKPIIIPKDHHIGLLLVRHFHDQVHHQGRHITEGAIRSAGYWIVGCRRLVNSVIQSCLECRKLRGKLGWTQMAELPHDRLEPGPPFSFVGVDVFGPWPVVVRRTTRGVTTTSKRWGVLFTCLVSRAVHVELVEEMSSNAFINALRRFLAIRGPVRQFRSDRGSNFIGAVKELGINASFIEDGPVKQFLTQNGSSWIFNPPYAHHFGGAWERMIGVCRRILDAILLENRSKDLTHETLSTFMAEACAIMNGRPLVPVSTDPESPSILTPSQILTHKVSNYAGNLDVTDFGRKDAMKSQWKLVQHLADNFWRRWQAEYMHSLQVRQKWQLPGETFKERDVVLVKDDDCRRNQWPLGVIDEVYPSKDSMVRKVKVSIVRGNSRVSYVRPISELVRLVEFQ